ncbi:MAG TPA: type II toxin-antitoxin system VapC family toxin [Bacteroidia bacterium]|nr:type II toxin-antitoxin system VapC family toxin [Bacteroidia bacterium]
MQAYADSSLLIKLYVREPNSPDALALVRGIGKPLLYTPLHQLEIAGAIRCNVKRGVLTASKAAQALLLLRRDLNAGVYVFPSLDWSRVFNRSQQLSRRHSRPLLARSLDLLHIACALELGVSDFLSFDDRQRKAAEAQGMRILP